MYSSEMVSKARGKLDFTCVHESDHLPALDPRAEQLFQYARYLNKDFGPKDYNAIARYYRVAAAYGHYKANHNLQLLVSQGLAASDHPATETIDLVQQLIDQNVPGGYYDMGHYLELGYGVKPDREAALRYFRKAADLGNPDAQYYLAELLEPFNMAPEVAVKMWQCAADQGHGDAAISLGIYLQVTKKDYSRAVEALQKGVAAGSRGPASYLEDAFKNPPPSDLMNYLALPHDPERSRRYSVIAKFIRANDGLNPKVPDIDKIVPLPPAPLPEWDGTFQWQKEQDAATPPPKPSDDLIKRLCAEKNLDPATGLPLPPPKKVALGTRVKTGQICPESGNWRVWTDRPLAYTSEHFEKGKEIPPYQQFVPRWLSLLDDFLPPRYRYWNVEWELDQYT